MKGKIKTMYSPPKISDEEIRGYMNFDKVLQEHRALSSGAQNISSLRNVMIGVGGVALIAIVAYVSLKNEPVPHVTENDVAPQEESSTSAAQDSSGMTMPDQQINETEKPVGQQQIVSNKSEDKISSPPTVEDQVRNSSPYKDSANHKTIYIQAEPVDGYPALYEYFEKELKYPETAVIDSIQGVFTVLFTINVSGKAEKIQIEQSLGDVFDAEVVRVIQNMPAWNPATYNGKPVPSKMSIPLTFQITKPQE